MTKDSIEVHIEKLAGIIPDGAAVFLRAPDKTFVIFIGSTEGEALARAIQGEETPRPLTHDLVHSILLGFDIEITRMVISQILEGTFCATLVMAQSRRKITCARTRYGSILVPAMRSYSLRGSDFRSMCH